MPKNRVTIYAVVRTEMSQDIDHVDVFTNPILCGSYLTLQRALEIEGKYFQEMKDRGMSDNFAFEVQPVTYYDE